MFGCTEGYGDGEALVGSLIQRLVSHGVSWVRRTG
jgi:hypothetical protein